MPSATGIAHLQDAYDALVDAQLALDRTVSLAVSDGVVTREERHQIDRRQAHVAARQHSYGARLGVFASTLSLARTLLHTGEITRNALRKTQEEHETQQRILSDPMVTITAIAAD